MAGNRPLRMAFGILLGLVVSAAILIGCASAITAADMATLKNPDPAQVNAAWVAETLAPTQSKLVACLDLVADPAKEGKIEKKAVLLLKIDAKGKVAAMIANVSYPGSIQIKPCFAETLKALQFPAQKTATVQVYQFGF